MQQDAQDEEADRQVEQKERVRREQYVAGLKHKKEKTADEILAPAIESASEKR
jgi:hypothetical protein